jgi:hypothetical protein
MYGAQPMKAIVYDHYGPPDVLHYEEIEKPIPCLTIRFSSRSAHPQSTPTTGTSSAARRPSFACSGLRAPKSRRLGADVAGVVEAVGRNVTSFKPGDAVFGTATGSFAEYVCASESTLALKPENLTWEQAASVPIAGITALQGLRDKGKVLKGQHVLINGAAGGVGTFDGWLFYDHHHRDPIAERILGLDPKLHVTRRWYYFVPAAGEPRKLVHRIEQARLDALPGAKALYSSWQELAAA